MIRSIVWFVHALAALLAGYLLAALLPGDNVNVNVLGALFLIGVIAIADVVLTVPLKYLDGHFSRAPRPINSRTWS